MAVLESVVDGATMLESGNYWCNGVGIRRLLVQSLICKRHSSEGLGFLLEGLRSSLEGKRHSSEGKRQMRSHLDYSVLECRTHFHP